MKPICCGEVVINSAMGKEFFYCRGCKNEVVLNTIVGMEGHQFDDPTTDRCSRCHLHYDSYKYGSGIYPCVPCSHSNTVVDQHGLYVIYKCKDCGIVLNPADALLYAP